MKKIILTLLALREHQISAEYFRVLDFGESYWQ